METEQQPRRRSMAVPAAIVIAGILIAASLFLALGGSTKTIIITTNSSQSTSTTSSGSLHQDNVTLAFSSFPRIFVIGDFTVRMTSNGTGYAQKQTPNTTGYEYFGFVTAFNVTSSEGETQIVPFFWNSAYPYAPSGNSSLPSSSYYVVNGTSAPPIATAFDGQVMISWSKHASAFYVTFVTQSHPSACLQQVPAGTNILFTYSPSFAGWSATYANGTEVFYSLNSCPVPATSSKYQTFLSIQNLPQVLKAENGTTYMMNPSCPCMDSANSTKVYFVLDHYTNQRTPLCGAFTYAIVGEIRVTVPSVRPGQLQFSGVTIQQLPGGTLYFSCVTLTT